MATAHMLSQATAHMLSQAFLFIHQTNSFGPSLLTFHYEGMHTDHFTHRQTDELWPLPDNANSLDCTTLVLLSGLTSAALLSKCSNTIPS